jgi:hypothetical protein
LSESMELSLIITTTFGSVFQRDFFSLSMWLLDFWFNNCHCGFPPKEYLLFVSFILLVPTILGE